jgi:hypothetical protein
MNDFNFFFSIYIPFTKEITSLDADSKHVKEVTKELQSQLDAVQGKLTEFKGLKDDVKTLKESLIDATDSCFSLSISCDCFPIVDAVSAS